MNDSKSDTGWVGFYNKAHSDFSESFKKQFAEQLEHAFNSMTEIADFAKARGFQILVGMEEMQITYKDGFGFGILELITPYSESIPQTFFWQAADVENAYKRDDLNEENIKIGFCSDFKKDYFRNFRKRKSVRTIHGDKLTFNYIEELNLYPDQWITIDFTSQPSQQKLEKLRAELQSFLDGSYVSDADSVGNTVRFLVDFQGTDFKIGKKQLRQFVSYLNSGTDEIKMVCVD